MIDRLRAVLETDKRVRFAILFGSASRGEAHATSDLDVAVSLASGFRPSIEYLGDLVSRLETTTKRTIDLVCLNDAPPALAFRIFRDGMVIVDRDRAALAARRASAILEYLDFRPVEEECARGVLAAAHGR
ncbi:MAG: nucleotidyltransferase domain-containing protein [Vicinamibacteria bacterium]|nr:nucleotidyltransferase domain-containing protein [Vicinamibacteria bacterium]